MLCGCQELLDHEVETFKNVFANSRMPADGLEDQFNEVKSGYSLDKPGNVLDNPDSELASWMQAPIAEIAGNCHREPEMSPGNVTGSRETSPGSGKPADLSSEADR